MQKRVLVLTTSALLAACGAIPASAQQLPSAPTIQEQPQTFQQQQRVQTPRHVEEDTEEDNGHIRRMTGWGDGPGWWHHHDWGRGGMSSGMMSRRGMMGPGGMGRGMMMRMMFSLMDADGDGTVSLQEFQSAHERMFRGMDTNKDGRLTLEEIQAFMGGRSRSSAQRQQ